MNIPIEVSAASGLGMGDDPSLIKTTQTLPSLIRQGIKCLVVLVGIYSLSSCVGVVMRGIRKKVDLNYQAPAPGMYADADFKGIRDFIKQSPGDVNIVLTHGLGDAAESHFDFMVEWMAYDLGLKLKSAKVSPRNEIPLNQKASNDPTKRLLGFGAAKLLKWEYVSSENEKKAVNFFFIYWSPITKSVKDFILKYDATEHRTGLSKFSKQQFLIDIFGDLALYLNTACQIQLHEVFLDAFDKIKGDIVVVGGGFGAQIMFDALVWELEVRPQGRKEEILADTSIQASLKRDHRAIDPKPYLSQKKEPLHTTTNDTAKYNIKKIFLITNQLPFTSLLNMVPEDTAKAEILNKKIYSSIDKFCQYRRGLSKKFNLELISFYDPNDPFGYRLPPSESPYLHVNNVSVKTSGYWTIDPKLTSELILPQIKSTKGSDQFLSLIDQKSKRQDILFNLKGPAGFSRNDYRIIGALTFGSNYDLVCVGRESEILKPRKVTPYKRKILAGLKIKIANRAIGKLTRKLEVQGSVLPFSIPSEFRDSVKTKDGKDVVLSTKSFAGMKASVAANNLTQLVTVHGVKNQPPDHFDELTGMIAKSLGFYSRPQQSRIECAQGEICTDVGPITQVYRPGTVKITEFVGTYGKRLIIYNVYLSSITKPAKEWLESTSIYAESSITSKLVKREMITDGFSDIELNFRHFKPKADSTLRTAFRAMEADHKAMCKSCTLPNAYYMSGSLGTRVLLDFINSARAANDKVVLRNEVENVLSRTKTWFMLTNQLIMTALKDAPFNGIDGTENDNAIDYTEFYKSVLGSIERNANEKQSPFEIVAFNDPNDLLSFVVPDSIMGVGAAADKIHNNYVDLASGLDLDMDALIRYTSKADRILQECFLKAYRKQLDSVKNFNTFRCNQKDKLLLEKSNGFRDYRDILTITKNRFEGSRFIEFGRENPKRINDNITAELSRDSTLREERLRSQLNLKKEWFVSDLYVSKTLRQEYLKKYKDTRRQFGKTSVIRRSNFNRLYKAGLIMPFLRNVSNYMHYQDFVVNFGQAHVGSKSSTLIATMMAEGFDAVAKTNVTQNLYDDVHIRK